MAGPRFVPLPSREEPTPEEMLGRAAAFRAGVERRRSVRQFSSRPVPRAVIEECIRAAGSAPSGANQQPWHFVAVSDPEVKRRIREAAEREEAEFYGRRAPEEWLRALAPLGTDEHKPFLEIASHLIVVFARSWAARPDGGRAKQYYVRESVGIATGILLTALHTAGLATLTHTPSPMGFLNEILDRPSNERPFLVLVVGHPAPDAVVPDIRRKPLDEIATFV
ncbi:MAG: nitroreductase family protein [Gemmatimonadota bacterium]